jgi:uncharacterized protein (DUF2236 family)
MESVAVSSDTPHLRLDTHFLMAPALRHLRASFAEESVQPWALWLVASEGTAGWVRYLEAALGEHLNDRYRARAIMTAACSEMYRRRTLALAPPLGQTLADGSPTDIRAFFQALYPGPVGTSIRWSLDGIVKESPGPAASMRGWRLASKVDAKTRWLEVSHHLGELTIVLTELLPKENVPRAIGWLGDVTHAFGKEIAELAASLFGMPHTMESAIETLRMGEFLFRVNPEHTNGVGDDQQIHRGVLGRFQAGISEVFGQTYSLTAEPTKPQTHTMDAPTWQPPKKIINRKQYANTLSTLAEGKAGVTGYFGPDTENWKCIRESVILIGGGRAAVMQLAHPFVAHAVRDHSVVYDDMLGRFVRTMSSAYAVVFGSIDDARNVGERVYSVHAHIAGALDDVPGHDVGRYHALDPEAVFWVGATLVDTSIRVFERMIRPLTMVERDTLVRESAAFWAVFGVPVEACPTKWSELHDYVERRIESLAPLVGEAARKQVDMLFKPKASLVHPIFGQLRLITAEMLPAPLQRAFRMELNPQERMLARSWIFAAEKVVPRLPSPLRYVPAYHQAQWRMRKAAS